MLELSVEQEVFLRNVISKEVKRLSNLVSHYRCEGLDTSILRDDILEMKNLYRQLLGVPFEM